MLFWCHYLMSYNSRNEHTFHFKLPRSRHFSILRDCTAQFSPQLSLYCLAHKTHQNYANHLTKYTHRMFEIIKRNTMTRYPIKFEYIIINAIMKYKLLN